MALSTRMTVLGPVRALTRPLGPLHLKPIRYMIHINSRYSWFFFPTHNSFWLLRYRFLSSSETTLSGTLEASKS